MRKLKKLQVPNARAFIERELVARQEALSRFELGQPPPTSNVTCLDFPCEEGILVCTTTTVSGSVITDTDDAGWLGTINTDTDGFVGQWRFIGGSGGTSSPVLTQTIAPGEYTLTLWLGGSSSNYTGHIWIESLPSVPLIQIAITFPDHQHSPGGHGDVTMYTTSFTVPEGYNRVRYRHDSKTGGWRYQARIESNSTSSDETCFITYQDSGIVILNSGSNEVNAGVFSLLATSSSNAFMLPTTATDVSEVFIDFLPTDDWYFVPESNMIFFPEALLSDTQVYARYLFTV